jgi:hypothetical protein
MNRGEVDSISSVSVAEDLRNGYKCQASVRLKGIEPPYPFSLLVPCSCYGAIVQGFGRRFEAKDVQALFVARIRQYINNGGLDGVPGGFPQQLVLDWREVDSLIP